MMLLLMNACQPGELVITQENTHKFDGVSRFNALYLLLPSFWEVTALSRGWLEREKLDIQVLGAPGHVQSSKIRL